jgi:hypothetical protein
VAPKSIGSSVVESGDPFADHFLGALGYEQSRRLADGQPDPYVQVRYSPARPALALRMSGSESGSVFTVPVTRVPIDRHAESWGLKPFQRERSVITLAVSTEPARSGDLVVTVPRWVAREGIRRLVDQCGRFAAVRLDPSVGEVHPVALSALIVGLAAAGLPILGASALLSERLLVGKGLADVLREVGGDLDLENRLRLARAGSDVRRAAWLEHDLEIGWGRGADDGSDFGRWAPRLRRPRFPSVTVILCSRRPQFLPGALAMLASQSHQDIQVVVGLHGPGFSPAAVKNALRAHGLSGAVVSIQSDVPLGAALNICLTRADGSLIVKWDDDDLYGQHHLVDLLAAWQFSRACMVGKGCEFVYFTRTNESIWRLPKWADSYHSWIAGGAMLIERSALSSVGGFSMTARAVDRHLRDRMLADGGRVFRTHSFGFVHRRHAGGRTWLLPAETADKADESYLGIPDEFGLGENGRFAVMKDSNT